MKPERSRHAFIEFLEPRIAPAVFTVSTLADSGVGSLRAAVLAAEATPNADTIVFKAGLTGTIVLTSGDIDVSRPLTVKGPGPTKITVDGNVSSRIFRITDGNPNLDSPFTVIGLALMNGDVSEVGRGGAIESLESLTVKNCVIAGNSAMGGGAISVDAPGGKVQISDTVISGNFATEEGGGLSLTVGKSITITRSLLVGNFAQTGGGAAIVAGENADPFAKIAISSSTFRVNEATLSGGGIVGLLSSQTLAISKTEISGNICDGNGGGGLFLDGGMLTMTGAHVLANRTVGTTDAGGGGINLFNARATITSTGFYANTAGYQIEGVCDGGAIYYDGANSSSNFLKIAGGTISGNDANSFGGGLAASNGGSVTVKGTSFVANRATFGNGGAIATFVLDVSAVALDVQGSLFEGNYAQAGGAMSLSGGPTTIKSAKFFSNRAIREFESDDSFGGAIAASTLLTVTSSTFNLNAADDWGGAVSLLGTSVYTFTGVTMVNNVATGSGGGIDAFGGTLNISKSRIVANQSLSSGGGLSLGDTITNIATTIITANVAATGGGIFVHTETLPTLAPSTVVGGNIAITDPDRNF